jgi:CMP/dCMP kinase
LEERAQRRYEELSTKGERISYKNVYESLEKRDQIDKTRDLAPLCAASDAFVINSDGMTIQEVYEQVLEKIKDC